MIYRRIMSALLAVAFAMALHVPSAKADGDWSAAYLRVLKQSTGKRAVSLCDLTGDNTPELVVLSTPSKAAASLKLYTYQSGEAAQLSLKDSQLSLKGVRSVSMQFRRNGSTNCLALSLGATQAGQSTNLLLGLISSGSGGASTVFEGNRIRSASKQKLYINGSKVGTAKYSSAKSQFQTEYKKLGALPSKTIGANDGQNTITSKFNTMARQYLVLTTAKSVALSKTKLSLDTGKSFKLGVKVTPAAAVGDTVSWTSSDTKLATVDDTGRVTTLGAGKVTITAETKSGKKKACKITIKGAPPSGIVLDDEFLTLVKGDKYTLGATILPEGATSIISWSSSNKAVATVSSAGAITAIKAGKVTITAKAAGKSATCKLVINDTPAVIVDISQHNASSAIDWKKVSQNVDLLILRCGVTRTETKPIGVGKDDQFAYFAGKCKEYGIPFGVYYYGKCSDEETAKKEAEMTWEVASPFKPLFYVYDVEEARLNKNLIETYMKKLKSLGAKKTGYYIAHHLYSKYALDTSLVDFIWLPHYGKNTGSLNSTPSYKCDIHQYTSVGRVPGFPGNVDVNRLMGTKPLSWFLK